jgi:hypothetical protein
MENGDLLRALALLAVTVLGFAALAQVLQATRTVSTPIRCVPARTLLEVAAVALVLALLPSFLVALGISGAQLWIACSACAGLGVPAQIAYARLAARDPPPRLATGAWLRRLHHAGAVLLALLNLVNASQVMHPVVSGPYLAAAIWQIGAGALLFMATADPSTPPRCLPGR